MNSQKVHKVYPEESIQKWSSVSPMLLSRLTTQGGHGGLLIPIL